MRLLLYQGPQTKLAAGVKRHRGIPLSRGFALPTFFICPKAAFRNQAQLFIAVAMMDQQRTAPPATGSGNSLRQVMGGSSF